MKRLFEMLLGVELPESPPDPPPPCTTVVRVSEGEDYRDLVQGSCPWCPVREAAQFVPALCRMLDRLPAVEIVDARHAIPSYVTVLPGQN